VLVDKIAILPVLQKLFMREKSACYVSCILTVTVSPYSSIHLQVEACCFLAWNKSSGVLLSWY